MTPDSVPEQFSDPTPTPPLTQPLEHSEKFRRQLRREAETWWQAGWIDAALYEKLADRYQFRRLEQESSHRFIAILMGLGSILLGLAAITFVAANWQDWSRLMKLLLLLGLFLGVNVAGFYLWRRPADLKGQQRLGQGLLLLGGLLFGANLALLSQMFHQSGNLYELFLVWGLGVILMAYSLRLVSLGVLSWILIAIGYWMSIFDRWSADPTSLWQLMIFHLPLVASGLFIPLAYRCRSRVLFGLASLLITGSLSGNLLSWQSELPLSAGWLRVMAIALPPALLWSYSSRIWRSSRSVDPFQSIARSLSYWWLGIPLFVLSFGGFWHSPSSGSIGSLDHWHPLLDGIVLTIITGLGWLQLRHDWQGWRQTCALHSGTIALLIGLMSLLLVLHWDLIPDGIGSLGTILFNFMLFLLAGGLIRDGLALSQRGRFWGGMTLLVLGILSRMLEYNTGLILKSIVFALCGMGVIAAGLWFERHAKPDRSQLSSPQQT
ncbi:MAG: DUF2157 domain-containing protein [Elainella sp. Prado103]|jgi:uncharacterized membrane protein|nr:DUF2157 domain-containing protein [Elainella sp. Prado103]